MIWAFRWGKNAWQSCAYNIRPSNYRQNSQWGQKLVWFPIHYFLAEEKRTWPKPAILKVKRLKSKLSSSSLRVVSERGRQETVKYLERYHVQWIEWLAIYAMWPLALASQSVGNKLNHLGDED